MDGAQARVQKAVSTMVTNLDKDCLRKLQADMYRCSTKCCENSSYSLEEVQHCIDQCSNRVNKAQNYIQNELQVYQSLPIKDCKEGDHTACFVLVDDDSLKVSLPEI
ncbi:hypothetical protein C0Q70_09731 [Pomacea canaliculata]|uniref:Protein FAM136A n=1 Tax=Pomacea canaliculata TaxID=400727 RepID=A0A2T7PAK9_POMCA|nr:hypothetical protein C0Q70_09731 [Pomacea canaliculata]